MDGSASFKDLERHNNLPSLRTNNDPKCSQTQTMKQPRFTDKNTSNKDQIQKSVPSINRLTALTFHRSKNDASRWNEILVDCCQVVDIISVNF
jgi:hypothetical protein